MKDPILIPGDQVFQIHICLDQGTSYENKLVKLRSLTVSFLC